MCFSQEISFIASAGLGTIGFATIKKVKQKKDYLFASFPLFFAFQQFSEGIIWFTINKENYRFLHNLTLNIYFFYAFILWPIAFPFFVQKFETEFLRKRIIQSLIIPGALLSFWYLNGMLTNDFGVIYKGSLVYYLKINNILSTKLIYLTLIILPGFIAKNKNLKIFSFLYLISFLITDIFYTQFFVSVWCFFAAILSAWAYVVVSRSKQMT